MSSEQIAAQPTTVAPDADFAAKAHVKSLEQYQEMYDRSINDPEGFWSEIAEQFEWDQKWSKVREFTFEKPVDIKWFLGGKTNLCVNALDRHLDSIGDQVALQLPTIGWSRPIPDNLRGRISISLLV